MIRLNLGKLAADVGREQGRRNPGQGAGAMAAIRENLAAIEALRSGGATWAAIAAGLAAQGVTQRDGGPITDKRLTALIDSIKRQDARRRARAEKRALRLDLARVPPSSQQARVGLAAELRAQPEQATVPPQGDAEEAIRRQQFEAIQSLLKNKD